MPLLQAAESQNAHKAKRKKRDASDKVREGLYQK